MSRSTKSYGTTDLACGSDYRKTKKMRDEKDRKRRKAQKKKVEEEVPTTSEESNSNTVTSSGEGSIITSSSSNNNNTNNNNVDDNGHIVDQSGDGTNTELTAEYSREFLDMETSRKWEKLEMIADFSMTRDQYIAHCEKTGSTDIVFSFANKNLFYSERNDNHFKLDTKKKRDKLKEDHPNDIAKSLEIHDFTSNGLNDHITLIETNVERFSNEGFIGNSDNITAVLMPNQLAKLNKTGQPFKVFNRSMDNNAMLFLQQNPGRSHKNIKKDIRQIHSNRYTIPINHPIIKVFNALNPEKEFREPSTDYALRKQKLVVVSKKFLSEYEPITTEAMKNSISYANITGKEGIVLTFKAPVAPLSRETNEEFVRTKGDSGKPWLGFFHDPNREVLHISFRLLSEYGKCGEDFSL